MNKNITEFIEKHPKLTFVFILVICFKSLYDALIYVFKDYKKDKDEYAYSSYWIVILGCITFIIMWLIFLSNRLKE